MHIMVFLIASLAGLTIAIAVACCLAIRTKKLVTKDIGTRESTEAELRKALQLKSEILANISHELRTPLTTVIGFVELALRGSADASSNRRDDHLRKALNNAQKLLVLINDLLGVSAVDAGGVRISHSEFCLDELVESCIDNMRGAIGDKPIKLIGNVDVKPIRIFSDRQKIETILANILSNAIKFTKQGSINIFVAIQEDAPKYAYIRVSDTGEGIPLDQLGSIFEKFRQVDGSSTRRYGGAGLGLYVAHRYAVMLGGRIAVTSKLHVGSTFEVTLPLHAPK